MKHLLLALSFTFMSASSVIVANSVNHDQREVFTPERLLPDGVDSNISINPYTGESGHARKGIIAATLNNVVLLNKYLSDHMSASDLAKVQEITQVINSIIPSLRMVGIFDLFTPEEWLSTKSQPGRVYAVVQYLQTYPKEITPKIRKMLSEIQQQTNIKVLSDSITTAIRSV